MDFAGRGPIVGRASQQSSLDRLIAGIAGGHGNLCWLEGEAGIGKSALIDAGLSRAAERGCRILRGAANELVAAFPLRLMADCLGIHAASPDAVTTEIAELLRGVPGADSADPILAASERMLELVDRMCAERPVVLAVEDMQWADEPSLLVWNRLARAVNQIPLLLIGSARPVLYQVKLDRLRDLVGQRGGTVLDLGPLDPASADALVAAIAGGKPGPRLAAATSRAGGNPLYLKELVEALARDGLIEVADGQAELRPDAVTVVPASLKVAIENRLRYLADDVQAALRIAAVMGNEFGAGEWATATGRSVVEVADMVEAAAADGVLSGVGDRLRFRHQLIHQVLAEQVPPAERPALHGEIARTLAESGYGVDAVARHLLVVPGPLGDWALTWLADLAEPALYALPQVSAELLERAMASVSRDDRRWEVLATRLSRVLFWLHRDEQATELAEAVAGQTSDEVLAARMRIQIIRAAGRTNRPGRAAGALVGRRPSDQQLPARWRARLAAWSALLLHAAGRISQGAEMAGDSMAVAEESGDPLAIACARHALAMCGDAGARPALIEAALGALPGQDPESTELRMILVANHIVQSADLAQREKGEAALKEGLLLAERAGTVRAAAILAAAAEFGYQYGRWDDALTHLAGIGRELLGADQPGPHHALSAIIALRRGDRAAADARLRELTGGPGPALPGSPDPFYPLTEALALRAEADGDLALAVDLMSGWLRASAGLGAYDRHADLPYLVYLALEAGDAGTAQAAAAVSQADVAVDGSPSRVAAARFCQGLVAGDADELLAVAETYEGYGWLPMQAFALEEAAVRLAAAGGTVRARAALTGAARIYAALRASWDLRRADTRLKRHGVRRGPNSIRRGPTTGWDALTPSERRIAQLVSRGLSNPDIAAQLVLSRRTVQTHVSNILAKLGLDSRLEIARAAARREQTSQ
jgi:DNA-binding CsgD family transcriptional regulator